MKKSVLYLIIWPIASLLFLGACGEKARQTAEVTQSGAPTTATQVPKARPTALLLPDNIHQVPATVYVSRNRIAIKTFHEAARGWGYDVYMNDKLYIHQPHIPAISGNQGFRDAAAAHKTANFIAWKIRHNVMPPSISPEELDSLGVR